MHNLIKIGLGLALSIVFPFMVGFGIEAFTTPPKQPYEICRVPEAKMDKNNNQVYQDPLTDPAYKECFDTAQEKLDIYNRNFFLTTTAVGFLAIAVGTLLFSEKMGPVGPGLVFGGLFTILYGTTRSFRSLDKMWLFFELLLVFVGIIIVTWRFLQTTKLQSKKKSS